MTAATPKITLRSPADLVAATPYLLGFQPEDSAVMVAFRDRSLVCVSRCDLPALPDRVDQLARELLDAMSRQPITSVAILGYGPRDRVGPAVRAVRAEARRRRLEVREALRVGRDRWWSYICGDSECCPPGGTPFDRTTSQVAAACTYQGLTALPSRQELAQQVAPLAGPARAAMTRATGRARARLSGRLAGLPAGGCPAAVLAEGTAAVTGAVARYAGGRRLDDDEVAWLSLLLRSTPVRDVAWRAIRPEESHLQLWLDSTRRVELELVAAPASLLAFTAWWAGNGALAGLALERALAADPSYSMARLLGHGLRHGLPPSMFDGWGTPEWPERSGRPVR
jgi:hypothetical protein